MKSSALFLLAAAADVLASPAPSPTLAERATELCGQWDSLETGGYTIYNNLWGQDSATSGSQCTTVEGMSGSNLAWSTSWTWAGGQYNVKSYANAVLASTAKQLSAISSMPSTWSWSYTGSDVVANVAYDAFTSSTSSGDTEYEVMIWLAAIGGAGPISSTGSVIATPTVAGTSWNLYYGLNGSMKVYSFVAASQVTNFNGDVKEFLTYLTESQGLPASQYLTSIGAGTEPFVGTDAVHTTSAYSLAIN